MAIAPHEAAPLLCSGEAMLAKAYLNTAAEGLLLRAGADAVGRYLQDKSTGEPGRVPMFATHERARGLAADLFSVKAAQVALVSSTTEALNAIAHGIDWRPDDEVVFTSVEFPSNMFPWVELTKRGVRTRIVRPREGLVHAEDLIAAFNERTRLVTLSQVSYATGQHLDPTPVWEKVRGTKTLLCVDATQAAGRVEVRGDRADFVIASSFKWLNSIHGSAILTASDRAVDAGVLGPAGWLSAISCYSEDRLEKFHPKPDAGRFHSGMPNFDSVYSLDAALEFHRPETVRKRRDELDPLVEHLRTGLAELGVNLLTPARAEHRAGIVAFRHAKAEVFKKRLAEQGIFIHADDGRVRSTVHWYNTPEHVERYHRAVQVLVGELGKGG